MAQNKKNTNIFTLNDMLTAAKFVSKIQAVLLKSLSLLVTAVIIERSFSTLWQIKAWLRSTDLG